MRWNRVIVATALQLFAACQLDDRAPTAEVLTHTLTWHQSVSEIDDCHVFKLGNADPVEVDRITVRFPPGSHHVQVYRSDTPEPDGVHDCWSGIDLTRWQLVVGVQTQDMDWRLPDQLTIPFAAHQQLLVQVHWLNSSDGPIDRDIDLSFHTTEVSRAHVGTLFAMNKQTAMAPHERKTLRQWCPMPAGSHLLALMGHFHGLGTHYAADARPLGAASGTPLYEALDEQTFQFKTFEPAFAVPAGTGIEFECDYLNTRDVPVTWGADTRQSEHCNLNAYYYPAVEGAPLTCMVEAVEVQAIVAPKPRIAPGTSPIYTVVLSEPAELATTLQLVSSDPTALLVPATVPVPQGARQVTFAAKALRSASVTITATLGTTSKSLVSRVGGLVLSEVFVGGAGGRQWVELANLTDEPIDLTGYSLGAGSVSYAETRVQLGFTLPPRGCAVVGGPERTGSQPPYDQIADFEPDLGPGTDASGVALFDVKAGEIAADTLPYDAVVYGHINASLRAPSGALAPVVPRAAADGSLLRTAEPTWQAQPTPSPGICEVR
jgi:hypothetical protein